MIPESQKVVSLRKMVAEYARSVRRSVRGTSTVRKQNSAIRKMCQAYTQELFRRI